MQCFPHNQKGQHLVRINNDAGPPTGTLPMASSPIANNLTPLSNAFDSSQLHCARHNSLYPATGPRLSPNLRRISFLPFYHEGPPNSVNKLSPSMTHCSCATSRDGSLSRQMADWSGHVTKAFSNPCSLAGYSDVYLGYLSDAAYTKVAIKVLRVVHVYGSEQEKHEQICMRFSREARLWRGLCHINIVPLIGYALMDAEHCLLSPWFANGNAAEYIFRFPEVDRIRLIHQISNGVGYLHTRQPPIAHGDLKGCNILINDEGDAMICDFGLSCEVGETSAEYTGGAVQTSTIRWSPIEVINGAAPCIKSDIYSFACLALELITGRVPYHYLSSDLSVIRAIMDNEKLSPVWYPELPADHRYWDVLSSCWTSEPSERPSIQNLMSIL